MGHLACRLGSRYKNSFTGNLIAILKALQEHEDVTITVRLIRDAA